MEGQVPQRFLLSMTDIGLALTLCGRRQRVRICLGLLWVLLFVALQSLVGALVVSTLAQGPVTEVCTPQGMQWVAMEAEPETDDSPAHPQVLASTCVWSMAHVAVPVDAPGKLPAHAVAAPQAVPSLYGLAVTYSSDRTGRVLLMAPMRAPPFWQS